MGQSNPRGNAFVHSLAERTVLLHQALNRLQSSSLLAMTLATELKVATELQRWLPPAKLVRGAFYLEFLLELDDLRL